MAQNLLDKNDTDLMLLVAAGDRDAVGVLFERHHGSLYRYFYSMTRSRADSMDSVQDVFDRLIRYGHTFRGGTFLPWVFRIAKNVVIDRQGRSTSKAADTADMELPDSAPLPDDRLESSELHATLHRALEALRPPYREVLVLSRYAELSYDEIATLLDCSVGAVKVRVHRALISLRKHYQEIN